MVDFDYTRPRTLDEALALLAAHPEARPLAGGQTLLPTLKQRLARPTLRPTIKRIGSEHRYSSASAIVLICEKSTLLGTTVSAGWKCHSPT